MTENREQTYLETMRAIEQSHSGGGLSQFVSFRVGNDDYAIDILSVREIKGWTRTTSLPSQPDYVRGVLNLRGAIVPVFDLARRFGKDLTAATSKHVVIIVTVKDRLIGLLVDQVSDILSVAIDEIGPIPETDASHQTPFLSGVVTINDQMVILLDLNTLFDTLNQVAEAAQTLAA